MAADGFGSEASGIGFYDLFANTALPIADAPGPIAVGFIDGDFRKVFCAEKGFKITIVITEVPLTSCWARPCMPVNLSLVPFLPMLAKGPGGQRDTSTLFMGQFCQTICGGGDGFVEVSCLGAQHDEALAIGHLDAHLVGLTHHAFVIEPAIQKHSAAEDLVFVVICFHGSPRNG